MTAALPIIDMATYRAGAADAKAALIAEIAGKSRALGFFYLVNHGIPDALLSDQIAWGRRFFALPLEAKAAVDFRKPAVRRGYEPLALQTLQAGAAPDQKEAFSYGSEPKPGTPATGFEGPNQWPVDGPGFDAAGYRAQLAAYRAAMLNLGREVCGLIAASLDLPEDFFADALDRPSVDIRLLHYPPRTTAASESVLGAGAHTDWGLITLLLQDDCGGLEIEMADAWLKADPIPGALIVNLGDMVVRLTNGRYASNVHRVLNTAPGRDRYSVATFFNPNADYVVECAPTCLDDGPPPAPITFAEHITDMVWKTYAA